MMGAVFGVAAIFTQWPEAERIVQLLGATYLMYLAYRIAVFLKYNQFPER